MSFQFRRLQRELHVRSRLFERQQQLQHLQQRLCLRHHVRPRILYLTNLSLFERQTYAFFEKVL